MIHTVDIIYYTVIYHCFRWIFENRFWSWTNGNSTNHAYWLIRTRLQWSV